MGVTGLHQQLKEIQTPSSLSNYKGKTLAVDTYGWLHKATVSCAQELCQDLPTNKYISSITKKIDMLRYFGVEPYLVFDGASLPTKAQTAKERRLKREEAQRKADQLVKSGNRKLAWKEFMKAAAVTSHMAKSVMAEMDRLGVKYVVAPYEADPQMVYLEKIGEVDGILSEDSDLLIFGCKKLITKLNDYGECIEINRDDFVKVKTMDGLSTFTPKQLRLVAMLSGCDYTKGIPGIGLKTAFNLVKKYNNLERVIMALRAEGKKAPEDFDDEVLKADLAFQFQKVFNTKSQTLETLNEYPSDFPHDMELVEQCCGLSFDNSIHIGISNGTLDPNTHDILVSREQNIGKLKSKSFNDRPNYRTSKPQIEPAKSKSVTIDKFFNVKSATKVKTISPPVNNLAVTEINEEEVARNSSSEKLSPMHKRSKKAIDISQDLNETPKLSGKFSKFFNTSKSSPNNTLPTPQSMVEQDITGDSEISEASSPVSRVKVSRHQQVDTKNMLENLTDNDEEPDEKIEEEEKEEDDALSRKSSYKETVNKLSEDFDFDNDNDEIEESPVKTKVSDFKRVDKTHYLGDQTDIKRVIRETFLFNPNSNKKFEVPATLKRNPNKANIFSPPTLSKGIYNQQGDDSNSSLSSTSSIDLKSDDLMDKNNSFDNNISDIPEPVKPTGKRPTFTSSLSKFAFKG